jgi:hypothetical protein
LVASFAAALRSATASAGDRVAVLPRTASRALAFWATQALGGITAALNGWWTADEIATASRTSQGFSLRTEATARAGALGCPSEIESGFEGCCATRPAPRCRTRSTRTIRR